MNRTYSLINTNRHCGFNAVGRAGKLVLVQWIYVFRTPAVVSTVYWRVYTRDSEPYMKDKMNVSAWLGSL